MHCALCITYVHCTQILLVYDKLGAQDMACKVAPGEWKPWWSLYNNFSLAKIQNMKVPDILFVAEYTGHLVITNAMWPNLIGVRGQI